MAVTTAQHNDTLPGLDWYLMPEAFSAPLIEAALDEYGLAPGSVILDPFSGTGTTALVAKLRGMRGIGLEANPFLAWAARTKLRVDAGPSAFSAARERVLARIGDLANAPPVDLPDMPRVDTWITTEIAHKVVALRTAIEAEPAGVDQDLLLLALAAILRPVGNLKLTAHAFGSVQRKERAPVRELFEAKTAKILADLESTQALPSGSRRDAGAPGRPSNDDQGALRTANRPIERQVTIPSDERLGAPASRRPHFERPTPPTLGEAEILTADARQLDSLDHPWWPADLAITSPPYLNNLDYTMQTRLELFFLGHVANLKDIRTIRKRMVICDAKAMYRDILDHELVAGFPAIQGIAEAIAERHAGKNWGWDYPFMVRQYFGGLYRVLAGAKARLRPGARFVLVVGESSHSGIKVPVPALLGELGEALGYTLEEIRVHRTRRSSSHSQTLEESSVVLLA